MNKLFRTAFIALCILATLLVGEVYRFWIHSTLPFISLKELEPLDYGIIIFVSVFLASVVSFGLYTVGYESFHNKWAALSLSTIVVCIAINSLYKELVEKCAAEFQVNPPFCLVNPSRHVSVDQYRRQLWSAKELGDCGFVHFVEASFPSDTVFVMKAHTVKFSAFFPVRMLFSENSRGGWQEIDTLAMQGDTVYWKQAPDRTEVFTLNYNEESQKLGMSFVKVLQLSSEQLETDEFESN